jgi:SAM-dependent methyltransferase
MINLPDFVCCPECHTPLKSTDASVTCERCLQRYPVTRDPQLDLRPKRRFGREYSFTIDPVDPIWSPSSEADKSGPLPLFDRSVKGLEQIIPPAPHKGARALEVGSGPRGDVRAMIERAGFSWVGVDWEAAPAHYLADIHALPFVDEAFSLVASDAVLEHVRYPHVAIKEMARVLRPGGIMVGEVAFLQPYHTSYYHMTHAAILDLASYAGLTPSLYSWGSTSALEYLMARYAPSWKYLRWPLTKLLRYRARSARASDQASEREIHFACTVLFVAQKPLSGKS